MKDRCPRSDINVRRLGTTIMIQNTATAPNTRCVASCANAAKVHFEDGQSCALFAVQPYLESQHCHIIRIMAQCSVHRGLWTQAHQFSSGDKRARVCDINERQEHQGNSRKVAHHRRVQIECRCRPEKHCEK